MSESAEVLPVRVELGTLHATGPTQLVAQATEMANALADLIANRQLFSMIQGKRYVRCEGWTTLAAMLGVTPHELSVEEPTEGTFVATVELRRLTDGQPVGRASAECGMDESLWSKRDRYARRSMALTRATAKACRLSFSWIMVMAGFEATPSEEMPSGGRPKTVTDDGEILGPDTVMPFGKPGIKGTKVRDLSDSYLAWAVKTGRVFGSRTAEWQACFEAEIKRRAGVEAGKSVEEKLQEVEAEGAKDFPQTGAEYQAAIRVLLADERIPAGRRENWRPAFEALKADDTEGLSFMWRTMKKELEKATGGGARR